MGFQKMMNKIVALKKNLLSGTDPFWLWMPQKAVFLLLATLSVMTSLISYIHYNQPLQQINETIALFIPTTVAI